MKHCRYYCIASIRFVSLLAVALLFSAGAQAAEISVGEAIRHDTSPPMSNVAVSRNKSSGENRQVPIMKREKYGRFPDLATPDGGLQSQTAQASQLGPTPGPIVSEPGLSEDDNAAVIGGRIVPPDVNGDIGLDDAGNRIYVQYINSVWGVFDVNGTLREGPFAGNTFWQGFGGPCEANNDGDPVVLYDDGAGRWLFSQFSINEGIQCVAISTTSDPLGPFHRYAFQVTPGGNNDYPKLGVWDDGTTGSNGQSAYTFTLRDFGGAGGSFSVSAGVMERDAMLAGDPASFVKFSNSCNNVDCIEGQLPPHLAGPTPPAGTCPTFWAAVDAAYDDSPYANDGYRNHTLCVDWSNTGTSTYTEGPLVVAGSNFDRLLGKGRSPGFSTCIDPVRGGEKLDCLAAFTMNRVQYRWFVDQASVVFNTTVDAGNDRGGIRWAETRSANGDSGWTLGQDGTFAPNDGIERWMGSIAQDGNGNMALGYSATSRDLFPSVRYTSRTAADTPGTMAGGEASCHEGTGAQTSSYNRWGDYSSMSIDPTDDCTFWYTQEYYETTGSFDFKTRICSFQVGSCGEPPATNQPPTVAITAPANNSSFGPDDVVTFTATATDSEDDPIFSPIVWNSSEDGPIGTGNSVSTSNLSLGNHTITAEVTDSGDPTGNPKTGSDSITITIEEVVAGISVHVASIVTGKLDEGRGLKRGEAVVTLADNNGDPVGAGYTVSGKFLGTFQDNVSDDTENNSSVTFTTTGTAKGKVNVSFCVSGVAGGSLTYDENDNAAGTTCQ
jgi:hypothetical protein